MPTTRMPHHGGAHHGSQRPTDLVIHDEEFALSNTSAEQIGAYFANPKHGSSCAHRIHDADSTVISGDATEVCYNAPPNTGTIGHERDGYASWSAEQWNAPAAQRTTCRTAANMAADAVRYSIPVVLLGAADLAAGKHGFQTHASRSKAFGKSVHSDPGPNFPLGAFMALVQTAAAWCRDAAAFQAAHGLTVDGDVGPQTLDAMTDALWGSTPGDTPVAPSPPAPTPPPATFHDESPTAPLGLWEKGPRVKALQGALGVTPDGYFGLNTEAAVRQFQAAHGLTVDGIAGPATIGALTPPPTPPVPLPGNVVQHAGLTVDGDWGPATTRALQAALRVTADGDYGPQTKKALQARLGVRVDGVVGPLTVAALQRHLGVPADGQLGPVTVKALQARLNAGTF